MSKGIIALLFSTILYGLLGVYSRFIGIDFGIFYQAWTRNLIISLLILPFLFFKLWKKIKRKDIGWFILRSIADLVTMVTIFVAFNKLQIGISYFLFYAGSVIGGYMIGKFAFNEKLTLNKIFSLFFGLVGLILIYSFTLEKDKILFYFLANLAGLSSAVWNIFSKKVSSDYSIPQIVFIDSFLTLIFGLILSLYLREHFIPIQLSNQWIANLLFAFNSLATSFLIVYGFRFVEAHYGSIILLLEVLFGIFFGFIFFKEIPTVITLVGGVLIIVAVIIPKLSRKSITS